jgi:hypothetical protein
VGMVEEWVNEWVAHLVKSSDLGKEQYLVSKLAKAMDERLVQRLVEVWEPMMVWQ